MRLFFSLLLITLGFNILFCQTVDTDSLEFPNANANANSLDSITTRKGNNVSGGLIGRKVLNKPRIVDEFNTSGTVVLNVCVDASGKVTSADFTQRGSRTTDSELVLIARKNAKAYKFISSSIDKQCGTITYVFKVK